jgi:nucleoside-diphosphate-sugar epimerase
MVHANIHKSEGELVLVTGASGFLAAHIIKLLLESGYRVRGTVRDLNKDYKELRTLVPNAQFPLQLVEADLTKEHTWSHAVVDCDFVIHTAHIIPTSSWNCESEVVDPNVNGTKALLRACCEPGSRVKRFVLTSSISCICGDSIIDKKVYTEIDWADVDQQYLYTKGKILTEKAMWEFVKQNKNCGFECTAINPGFMFGPLLTSKINISVDILRRLVMREMPFYALVTRFYFIKKIYSSP